MRKRVLPALCLCLLSASVAAQSGAQPSAGQAQVALETAPEQIRVVAQRPGPGMWKVFKG